jgi:ubiquinone biosynthesis monooxygenase Coq7
MLAHEEQHLKTFVTFLLRLRCKNSFFNPLWNIGGYFIGSISSFLGTKSAHAVTIIVEEIILEHYEKQAIDLRQSDIDEDIKKELLYYIEKFRQDEEKHLLLSEKEKGRESPFFSLLNKNLGFVTRSAIFLSKKI